MVISLFCAYGMTTDVLVQRMKAFAAEEDSICAYSINDMERIIPKSDVALLGPQARMYLRTAQGIGNASGVPVEVIEMVAYGRGDGQGVYRQAKQMYEKAKK